jgi:cytochrome c6
VAGTASAASGLNKNCRANVQLIQSYIIISMKKLLIVTCALIAAGAVSVRAADVKETYVKNCAKCHAEDGKGKTKMGEKLGVKDYTDAKVQAEMKDEKMTKAIKEGVKEEDKTKMKAFTDLTDDEVKGLVAYVRAFKK